MVEPLPPVSAERLPTGRRGLLAGAAAALLAGPAGAEQRPTRAGGSGLRIARVLLQRVHGRRATPVAPNAYAPYRGYDVFEPTLRIQTANGLEGIGCYWGKPEPLRALLGLEPAAALAWDGERVVGLAPEHAATLATAAGADVALLDLLGKAAGRPIADLLGPRARDSVPVYDSSLYMEDLLTPAQREGLAYLRGPPPADPAELVARKAEWLLGRQDGIRIFKIKVGRAKWMDTFDAALRRDVAVVHAVRRAVGPDVTLFVDGNNGYDARPPAAADFALRTADARLLAMEEMFEEERVEAARELKRHVRAAGLPILLADGETREEGLPEALLAQRFVNGDGPAEPLFDIDQPDMNLNGLLRMRAIAARCAAHGVTLVPHNFGSKLGFYAQAHLGLVVPNFRFCESDDSDFPAFRAEGIRLEGGSVGLSGAPGLGVTLGDEGLDRPSFVLEA